MLIDVSKIIKNYGYSQKIEAYVDIKSIEFNGNIIRLKPPVSFTGKVTNLGEVLLCEGTINATIDAQCDRCLKQYDYLLTADISEKFSNTKNNIDEDLRMLNNENIDIDEVIQDNLLINMPLQFICSEKCKGMCPKCGINLNEKDCSCNDEKVDPRFEILKKLLQ